VNLLAGTLYDPAAAVTKATTAGSVMAVFDTTNLRLTGTVPPSGKIYWKIKTALHGAATYPQCLLGVMSGASVVARAPVMTAGGNLAATTICAIWAEGIITGTPGAAFTYDAAWACETGVASTGIKYGGPNDTTVNNAFGGISFELWDCCPVWTPSSGAAPTTTISARIDTVDDLLDTEMPAVTSSLAALTTAVGVIDDFVDTEIANIQSRLPAALVSGRMDVSVGAMAADVLTAAATASDFGTEVGTAVWATATRALTDKSGFGVSSLAADTITAASVAADTGTEIATAVWASGTRVLTAGTNIALAKGTGVTGFNDLSAAQVNAEVDTGIADAALATAANLATVAGYLDTEIVAIKNKTDNLPSDPADASDIAALFVTVNGKLDTIDDFLDTEVAAIKLKTDNLPSDPADASVIAGRFDTLDTAVGALVAPDNAGIAAVQAKTDLLTFTGSNVNANTETFNGVEIIGTGGSGDKFRV
jgi:hypothetical protein